VIHDAQRTSITLSFEQSRQGTLNLLALAGDIVNLKGRMGQNKRKKASHPNGKK
jgi:hypothetical protein